RTCEGFRSADASSPLLVPNRCGGRRDHRAEPSADALSEGEGQEKATQRAGYYAHGRVGVSDIRRCCEEREDLRRISNHDWEDRTTPHRGGRLDSRGCEIRQTGAAGRESLRVGTSAALYQERNQAKRGSLLRAG